MAYEEGKFLLLTQHEIHLILKVTSLSWMEIEQVENAPGEVPSLIKMQLFACGYCCVFPFNNSLKKNNAMHTMHMKVDDDDGEANKWPILVDFEVTVQRNKTGMTRYEREREERVRRKCW
jgi:hypothetical protein